MLEGLFAKLQDIRTAISVEMNDDALRQLQAEEQATLEEIARVQQDEETIAAEVADEENPLIINVRGQDINFRDWITKEQDYRVIAIATKTALSDKDYTHNEIVKELNARLESERQQHQAQIASADAAADAKYNELNERYQSLTFKEASLTAEIEAIKTDRHDIKFERDDFERRLQAATNEIDSLKNQLATQSVPQAPISNNLTGDLASAIREAEAAKPVIYDVEMDHGEINYKAKLLATDEVVEGKVVYIRKYRIATKEEVSQFRQEREEAQQNAAAELESIPSNDETNEPVNTPLSPPSIPHVDPGHGVDEDIPERQDGTNGGGGVATVEDRLAALEQAVFGQVRAAA